MAEGRVLPIYLPHTDISGLVAGDGFVVFAGASPTTMTEIVRLDLADGHLTILQRSASFDLDPACLSVPDPVRFPTSGGQIAYGFYYPPRNGEFSGPAGERPPLLVRGHGGPSGASSSALSLALQFWTSRGLAVLDVYYRGITGVGRPHRAET